MSEEKRGDVEPGINQEERPDLQDYKSKDKATAKKTDFTSVTTVPTLEGDVQAETELEIPLEDNKECAQYMSGGTPEKQSCQPNRI
jgi:hypothetical protein